MYLLKIVKKKQLNQNTYKLLIINFEYSSIKLNRENSPVYD